MSMLTIAVIADMYGPKFLLVYAGVIVVGLIAVRVGRRLSEPLRGTPVPELPVRPDPYEIAYLREGPHAVGQVAVLRLLQRKLLEVRSERRYGTRIEWAADNPQVTGEAELLPLEKDVLSF